ncbi:hypothetical protein BZG36_03068 [Bifiguratus adelaidae]|uniref:SET domain-containing protein n=1 Tax=Bifiguratus adelaidae TaxID=1938954 RepID=A0A261XZI6_9FUNG|nr:hypothetical protein BZG36_03068 [Bifiguratus adelaidae]
MGDGALDSFLIWLRDHSVDTSKVTLRHTNDAGTGLFFADPAPSVPSAEEYGLFDIPLELTITADAVWTYSKSKSDQRLTQLLFAARDSFFPRHHPATYIQTFLLYERYIDPSDTSPWRRYIEVLPQAQDFLGLPIFWDSKDHALLQGTRLESAVKAKLRRLHSDADTIIRHVKELWNVDIDASMWMWADAVYWSRIIDAESQDGDSQIGDPMENKTLMMVPLVDFANHSSTASNARWVLDTSKQTFTLVTLEGSTLRPGEQIFISYGTKSNAELLFMHGFCEPDNDVLGEWVTSVEHVFSGETNSDMLALAKIEWLKQSGMAPILRLNGDQISNETIVMFALAVITPDDGLSFQLGENDSLLLTIGNVQIIEDNPMASLERAILDAKEGRSILQKACHLLSTVIRHHLEQACRPSDHSPDSNTRNASLVRHNDTRLLSAALSTLEAS